ncbi:MAG: TetR/AcrR family transcriptional regulator [Actinobacteria bacterium]|nr:TetR/AcrR family transcriptional regulator [Actinomycetota bacterium]
MSGRRERKKQETRDQIIRSAEALFAERGLQEPTMEDLAAAADVAVATLYNYFGSKLALQMAVFAAETADIVARGAVVGAHPGDDPEEAVGRLFDAYIDGILAIDPRLLVEAIKRGFGDELSPELVGLDLQMMQQLGDLLRGFARRGLIASDHVEDGVFLLYSALITVLLFFMTMDGFGPDEIRAQVRRLVAAAFRGLDES